LLPYLANAFSLWIRWFLLHSPDLNYKICIFGTVDSID
jgi:hypothetical protein